MAVSLIRSRTLRNNRIQGKAELIVITRSNGTTTTRYFELQVPSREVDKSETKFWTQWNADTKQFFLQFAYKVESNKPVSVTIPPPPPPPPPPMNEMRPPGVGPPAPPQSMMQVPHSMHPPPLQMFNPVPPPPQLSRPMPPMSVAPMNPVPPPPALVSR